MEKVSPDREQHFKSKEELAAFLQAVNSISRRATGKPLIDVRVGDPETTRGYGHQLAAIPEGYVAIVRPNGIQYVPKEEDPFSDENFAETVAKLPYRFYDDAVVNALDPMTLLREIQAAAVGGPPSTEQEEELPPSAAAAAATEEPHGQTPTLPTDDSGSST